MEWCSLSNLRNVFINFFKSKGHLNLESFSLLPQQNDSSLLLINSGMAPMKNWFLGLSEPLSKRIVTCQKCVRTTDLQNVGHTNRHGTFFEMLGNFSFGDYFKKEAIEFAHEFVFEVLKFPHSKVFVSVFEDDLETEQIWLKMPGIKSSNVVKLTKIDNFWEIGKGPCGPCSELYFDRGKQFGCGSLKCGPGCGCDRFIEFWNLVFSQFCNEGDGVYSNLKQKNIDTGMGLERLACLVQNVNSLFEIDSLKKILFKVCELGKVNYGANKKIDVAVRIIVDHVRSSVFLISDGVLPSNEGRGYVLRRLIRRACTNAKSLNINDGFLEKLASVVVEEYGNFYSNLKTYFNKILQILNCEEQNFNKVLVRIKTLFDDLIFNLKRKNVNLINAADAFKLCDTFGMPFDLLTDLAEQNGFEVDKKGFLKLLNEQKQRARCDVVLKNQGWNKINLCGCKNFKCEFVGYNFLKIKSCVMAIFLNKLSVDCANEGDCVCLIFNKTPFYAQGGGQVSDVGVAYGELTKIKIINCQKIVDGVFVHEAIILKGTLTLNDELTLEVDKNRHLSISRNHTCAHILHQVLINVLGEHVHQAGQLVDHEKLRFDFCCVENLTDSVLNQIETKVNEIILKCLKIEIKTMNLNDAKKLGAKALFNEKYGAEVRMVEVEGFSKELCAGTHVKNSGEIGFFKIVSQSSVGVGTRRIEAKTGLESLKFVQNLNVNCNKICKYLKVDGLQTIKNKFDELNKNLKITTTEFDKLKLKISFQQINSEIKLNYFKNQNVDVVIFDTQILSGGLLKTFGENLILNKKNLVALICADVKNKQNFLIACGSNIVELGANAGEMANKLAKLVNCKGGGKLSVAMAGVKTVDDFVLVKKNFIEILKTKFN